MFLPAMAPGSQSFGDWNYFNNPAAFWGAFLVIVSFITVLVNVAFSRYFNRGFKESRNLYAAQTRDLIRSLSSNGNCSETGLNQGKYRLIFKNYLDNKCTGILILDKTTSNLYYLEGQTNGTMSQQFANLNYEDVNKEFVVDRNYRIGKVMANVSIIDANMNTIVGEAVQFS
jgi:hypothetical protein